VQVRPKEGPSHLRSSPPTFGETWAPKRGVEPSEGGCKPPVRSMKRSLPRRKVNPRRGANGEPSLAGMGEGHGRGEELGRAALTNPVA